MISVALLSVLSRHSVCVTLISHFDVRLVKPKGRWLAMM